MKTLISFDWAIKYLLRNKANFDILEGFLSELLKRDIIIESILESESNKITAEDKQNRVDLIVQADRTERIIIEIQCSRQWDYFSRMLYATSKTISENLYEGNPYSKIPKVISVNIVFFDLGSGKDYLYKGSTTFYGMHLHDTLMLGEEEKKFYLHANTPSDVFPEYYLIKVDQFRESIKDKLDEWIYFLKNANIQPEFNAKGIQIAAQKLDVLKLSEKERRAYERYSESLSYEASMTDLPYHLGKDDGIAIGETKKAEAIAKSMLADGFSLETIAKYTGLGIDSIKKIST